jgi:hypothetical protein
LPFHNPLKFIPFSGTVVRAASSARAAPTSLTNQNYGPLRQSLTWKSGSTDTTFFTVTVVYDINADFSYEEQCKVTLF